MNHVSHSKEIKFSLFSFAALVLAVGYVDLWRGGITLSAFLLAIGYCVAIPAAIWYRGGERGDRREAEDARERPSYLAAGIASLLVLALYVATMAPNTAMWDTSEYIAAAYTFGLPHPPGNPFFVIVGRVFSLLPIASNVAARINVLAAVCSAAAAGLWFLVTEQVLRTWTERAWVRIAGASVAVLCGATAFTVWNQSVVNEKVYTVSLAGIALISWLAVRWSADPDDSHADRMLVLIAYLCGLGYANHMAGMLPAPAVGLAVLIRRPRTALRSRLLLACVCAIAVGMTPFATQPIRAAHFPAMNEGEPTACRTQIALSCTMSKQTYDAFMYNFDRGQYGKPDLSDRQASFPDQIGMWWMYFKWQWLRDPGGTMPFAQSLLATAFLVLGLMGGWGHYKRDRRTFWYFGALMFTTTLLLIYYLNFKLGASQDPTAQAEHEVRDRDYFFLWSFSAWSVWAALGLVYVWETVAATLGLEQRRVAKEIVEEPRPASWLRASPVLLLSVVPLFGNWSSASRAHHRTTRNVAADLLNSVEPYGVLVTVGDNDTFPLWYTQEVEGVRRDVTVANTSLLNTDWYARQLIRQPIYAYDAARGPALYRDKTWKRPTSPVLHMTFAEADAVPPYFELAGPSQFNVGPYHSTIDPRRLPHGVLERADALVLRMIQDNLGDRPFYFARSAGGYPASLGLGENVLTQGLASKLFVPPKTASRDTMPIQGDGWLDVPRTLALWNNVFQGHESTIAEGRWIDRPSASLPALYIFTGAELSDALRADGDAAEANKVMGTTKRVANAIGYGALIAQLDRPSSGTAASADSTGITLGVDARQQPKVQTNDPAVAKRRK
jgi:hypothetical protein